ncbi:MAG TPA: hypothetical protein VJT09_01475 [Pyrinomonadaceae bacterium]|nr:hypothetical protein [Pyrinomonadaceae bacterium]
MFHLRTKTLLRAATVALVLSIGPITFAQAPQPVPGVIQESRATVRQRAALVGHKKEITEVIFSPDGETLATGSEDGTVRLWNVNRAETIAILSLAEKHRLGGIVWSPDGRRVMTFSWRDYAKDIQLRVWDAGTGELKATIETNYANYLSDRKWSPDGRLLLTASEDGTVELWDAETGKLQKSFEQSPLRPDETKSFVKSIFTLKKYADLRFTRGYFDSAGQSLLTLSYNHSPKLWDMASGKLRNNLPLTKEDPTDKYLSFPTDPLFSPDRRLVVRHDDDGVSLLDTTTGLVRHSLGEIGNPLAFSPDGLSLLVVTHGPMIKFRSGDDELKLYDVATGQLTLAFEKIPGGVNTIYWSPEGGHLVMVGSGRTKTRLLDTRTGRIKGRLPYEGCTSDAWWGSGGCEGFHFSADGRITFKQKNPLKLWSTETGDLLATLEGMAGYARFSPTDKRLLVTRAKDKKSLVLWEVSNP